VITEKEKTEIIKNVVVRLEDLHHILADSGNKGKALALISHWKADPEQNLFTPLYPDVPDALEA
jgi:hypothetical protein